MPALIPTDFTARGFSCGFVRVTRALLPGAR